MKLWFLIIRIDRIGKHHDKRYTTVAITEGVYVCRLMNQAGPIKQDINK